MRRVRFGADGTTNCWREERKDDLDIDDIYELLGMDPDPDEPEPPSHRATIRDGKLTVVNWAPHLLNASGADGRLVRERADAGVTVADLWRIGEQPQELIVEYLAVPNRQRADRIIARWAESVGYSRLWLPDRLVELDSDSVLGAAQVECPTCGASWQDSSPNFWSGVRTAKGFPSLCPICNSDLPQWRWRSSRSPRAGSHK